MQDDPQNYFDDPALKDAVRRAWGGKPTPQEIRNRVITSTGQLGGTEPTRGRIARFRVLGLAAAAVLVLGCGLLAMRIGGYGPWHPIVIAPTVAAVLPQTLAADLVARHDGCSRAPDHHMPGVPRLDYSRIATDMKWRLGFPVLSGPLKEDGWIFEGASVCPVGQTESAHLLFKGQHHQAVSVFSLPASVIPAAENDRLYEIDSVGHPISGFVHGGGFYCVVGSGASSPLTLEEVRVFRDELQPLLTNPRPSVAAAGP